MNDLVVDLLLLALPLAVAAVAGRVTELRHLRALAERERDCRDVVVTSLRELPGAPPGGPRPRLVVAEVVLATDALTSFWTAIRRRFGGRLERHRRLLERARREATLRVVEEARQAGYGAVTNLRLTVMDIGGSADQRPASRVAVLAAGTACAAAADPARAAWLDDVPRAPEPLPGTPRAVL